MNSTQETDHFRLELMIDYNKIPVKAIQILLIHCIQQHQPAITFIERQQQRMQPNLRKANHSFDFAAFSLVSSCYLPHQDECSVEMIITWDYDRKNIKELFFILLSVRFY